MHRPRTVLLLALLLANALVITAQGGAKAAAGKGAAAEVAAKAEAAQGADPDAAEAAAHAHPAAAAAEQEQQAQGIPAMAEEEQPAATEEGTVVKEQQPGREPAAEEEQQPEGGEHPAETEEEQPEEESAAAQDDNAGDGGEEPASVDSDGGGPAAGEDAPATTVAQLEALVEAAAAAQMLGQRRVVINALIRQAEPGELPSGSGDISTTGACKAAIQTYCHVLKPGRSRLAWCLLPRLRAQARAAEEREREGEPGLGSIGEACRREVEAFQMEAASNINKNVPAAIACKRDVDELCADVQPEDQGAVQHCLRRNREGLRGRCKSIVERMQQDASDDFRLDIKLFTACADDRNRLCGDAPVRGGKVQECLAEHESALHWECKAELFRQEMEQSSDIRTSLALMHACMADKQRFCEGVAPGEASIKDCLEDHLQDEDFGAECRSHLELLITQRSQNFRLDSVIRTHCGDDVARLCGLDKNLFTGADFLRGPLTVSEESVSKCLQDRRAEIGNPACSARVQRVVAATLRDISFNHPLAQACADDRGRLCGRVPRGSGAVARCLAAHRAQLSGACAAMLFDTEVQMAENIDFNWPLKEACARELRRWCSGVVHGSGRAIRCLQAAAEAHADDFSPPCRDEVAAYESKAATDFRLNSRLAAACKDAAERACPNVCGAAARKTGCGGSMLHCLGGLLEDAAIGEECRSELLYYQRMQVRSFGNDAALAEACRADVDLLCGEAGPEAVLACLHTHRAQLSPRCRQEEARMDEMQGSSIELRPAVTAACRDERAAHCSSLRPGNSQVLNCLIAKAASEPDFSPLCSDTLDALQQRRLLDWRTDFLLRSACWQDVRSRCSSDNATADGLHGVVFRCLVADAAQLQAGCAAQVRRAARAALDFYRPGLPALEACDADVASRCAWAGAGQAAAPAGRRGQPAVGAVRACLQAEAEQDRAALAAGQEGEGQVAEGWDPGQPGDQPVSSEPGGGGGGPSMAGRDGAEVAGEGEAGARRRLARGDEPGVRGAAARGEAEAAAAGAATAAEVPRREPALAPACLRLLDVALPGDDLAAFQDGLTGAALAGQLAGLEASLGLQEGTLHNPTATAGKELLTLTGWSALAGLFALVTLLLAGVVYAVRRYSGTRGQRYTMVLKHEPGREQELATQRGRQGGGR